MGTLHIKLGAKAEGVCISRHKIILHVHVYMEFAFSVHSAKYWLLQNSDVSIATCNCASISVINTNQSLAT